MANIDYEVEVIVWCKGNRVDQTVIQDEDYGFLMKRLANWATTSEATKDL